MTQTSPTNFTNSTGDGTVQADGFIGPVGTVTPAAGIFTDLTQDGSLTLTTQTVTAAGSNSQANAAAITKASVIVVTVSATTRGVRLPAAAAGLRVEVINAAATAVKPYPATGDKIGAASTNAAGTAIAAGKGNIYVAQDATTWRVITGA
jgi:hypothetical protein